MRQYRIDRILVPSVRILASFMVVDIREQQGALSGQAVPAPHFWATAGAATAANSRDAVKNRPILQVFLVAVCPAIMHRTFRGWTSIA